jgi:hypothetical protein
MAGLYVNKEKAELRMAGTHGPEGGDTSCYSGNRTPEKFTGLLRTFCWR